MKPIICGQYHSEMGTFLLIHREVGLRCHWPLGAVLHAHWPIAFPGSLHRHTQVQASQVQVQASQTQLQVQASQTQVQVQASQTQVQVQASQT